MTDEHNKIEQLVTHALEDEAFKQELVSHPNTVIEQETGEKLPEGVEIRVVQETSNTRYLLLPSHSDVTPEKLEQLRQGAAGDFSSLIVRAIEDEVFKQELISDPNGVIERELGIQLPSGGQIRVLAQDANVEYLVLPPQPAPDGELSEEELEAVAGGGWGIKLKLSSWSITICIGKC